MNWQTSYQNNTQLIELTYSGSVTQVELAKSAQAALDLARQHGTYKVMTDCTAMQAGHSLADLYFLSDWLITMKAHRLKEAVIMPTEAASSELARFWETTCINRGLRVRVFDQREAAERWLLDSPSIN
jgi:hypothetical protein